MRSKKEPPPPGANGRGWTYGIFNAVDLARFFNLTPDVFSAVLRPDEIADALREAKAPEPWQNPPIAVGRIDNFAPIGTSQAYREVRAALSKLRRFLPDLVEEFDQERRFMNDPERFPMLPERFRLTVPEHDHLHLLRHLKSLLDEITEEIPPGKKGATANWHLNAISVLNLYRLVVGPKSGVSADGPAVRFIEIVMKRLAGEAPEKAAIEAAIRAWPLWGDLPQHPAKL
jgi:hypothetical protein